MENHKKKICIIIILIEIKLIQLNQFIFYKQKLIEKLFFFVYSRRQTSGFSKWSMEKSDFL